jgi:ABC-type glycerol-3-phosphate transport system substrate-binding protein
MLHGMRRDGLPTYPFFFEADPTQANSTLYQFVTATRTPILGPKLEPQFSAPRVKDVINWSIDLQRSGLTPPGLGGDAYSQGSTLFQNQTIAMGIQWNAAAIDLLDKTKSPAVYDKMGFGVMPYSPVGGPQANRIAPSVWGLGVSSFSNYPEQAFAYIAWFSSPEVAREYVTNGGGSSGRSSLLSDRAIVSRNPQYKTLLASFPLYARFPDNPAMAYIFNQLMSSAGNSIWSGSSSPEAALAGLDQDVASYLESAGEHVG